MKSPRDLITALTNPPPADVASWSRVHRVPLAVIESMSGGTWNDRAVVDCLRLVQHLGASVTVRAGQEVLATYRASKDAKPDRAGAFPQDSATSLYDVLRHLMGTGSPAQIAARCACPLATQDGIANLISARVEDVEAIAHFERVVNGTGGSVTVTLPGGQEIAITPPTPGRSTRSPASADAIMALVEEKDAAGKPRWTYQQIGDMVGVSKQAVFALVRRRKQIDDRSGVSQAERDIARLRLGEEFVEYRP